MRDQVQRAWEQSASPPHLMTEAREGMHYRDLGSSLAVLAALSKRRPRVRVLSGPPDAAEAQSHTTTVRSLVLMTQEHADHIACLARARRPGMQTWPGLPVDRTGWSG